MIALTNDDIKGLRVLVSKERVVARRVDVVLSPEHRGTHLVSEGLSNHYKVYLMYLNSRFSKKINWSCVKSH